MSWKKSEIETAIRLVKAGSSSIEISSILKKSRGSVTSWAYRNRIKIKSNVIKKWNFNKIKELIKLSKEGKTMKQVANHFGLSESTICNISSKNRISFKKKSPYNFDNMKKGDEVKFILDSKGSAIKKLGNIRCVISLRKNRLDNMKSKKFHTYIDESKGKFIVKCERLS